MSQSEIIAVTDAGNGYRIPVSYLIPDKAVALKDVGVSIPRGETIIAMGKAESDDKDLGLAIGTAQGMVKVSKTDFPQRPSFPVISLAAGDRMVGARWLVAEDMDSTLTMVSSSGSIIAFDASGVRASGSKAGGVKGMKLKGAGDVVVAFSTVTPDEKEMSMVVTYTGHTVKQTPLAEIPLKGRGGQGVATQVFKKGEDTVLSAFVGMDPVVVAGKNKSRLNLPPAVKRSARGTDLSIGDNVIMGSMGVPLPAPTK